LIFKEWNQKTFPLEFGPINLPEMLGEALDGFQEQFGHGN